MLGQPEVRYNGTPIPITRRQVRHMLVYLACSTESAGRSELASIFWQEETDSLAYSHLRDTLRRLREQLPEQGIVQKYGTQVFLDPEKTYVDVQDFSGKVASIKRSLNIWPSYKPIPAATLMLIQEAVQLWRSPRFLFGIDLPPEGEYADWVIKTGQQLEMDRQYLLGKLAENALVYNNPMQALEYIQMALQTDELNPELNLHYIETLLEMDRLPEAGMHLRYLQTRYEKQGLGDLPAALERLNHRMQHYTKEKLPEVVLGNLESFLETPFVGQRVILQEVDQVILNGEGVLITGAAGSGKTRLIHELESRYAPGFRFMHIPTKAVNQERTLSAIAGMLRQAVRKEEWKKLRVEYRRNLTPLLPELSLLYPEDPAAAIFQPDSKSNTVNEAIYQLLLICSHNKQLVIALDNAQWCDLSSLNTINYLGHRAFFKKNGRLIITIRSEILSEAKEQFFNGLRKVIDLKSVSIEALEGTDIGHLTQFLYGEKTTPELNEQLRSRSGGNPLILIEMIRSAMSQFPGRPLEDSIHLLSGSSTLAAIMQEKFQLLTRNERSLVNIAVVFGDHIDADLLAEVSGFSPELVAETLEELDKEHHLLQPVTWEKRLVYSFSHEKIGEIVESSLYPLRKQLMHERIAEALVKRGVSYSQDHARIAFHFEQAGLISQAIQYRLNSARAAWLSRFPDESFSQLEMAINLLCQEGQAASTADSYAVFSLLGDMAIERSDLETMQRAFTLLHQAGMERQSPLLTGAGLSGLALLHAISGKVETALETMDRALTFLEQAGSVYDLMVAFTRKAAIFMFTSGYLQARECYQRALALDKDAGEPAQHLTVRVKAKVELAFLQVLCGQPSKGLELAVEANKISELAFFSDGCLSANTASAIALYYLGRYPEVINVFQENIEPAKKMQKGRTVLYLHLVCARASLEMGKIHDCWQYLQKISDIEKQIQVSEVSNSSHAIKGEMYTFLNQNSHALEEFAAGSRGPQKSFDVLENRIWYGMLKRNMGEIIEGERMLEEALQDARQENMTSLTLPAELRNAIQFIRSGQCERAQQMLNSLELEVQKTELGDAKILFLLAKSLLADWRQDAEQVRFLAAQMATLAGHSMNAWIKLLARRLIKKYALSPEEANDHEEGIRNLLDFMKEGIQDKPLAEMVETFQQEMIA